MAYIQLIHNLTLLVTLSVLSGIVRSYRTRRYQRKLILQGVLFGCATLAGMLNPMVLTPGIFLDGQSVILSLCGLFFGPVAVSVAGAMAVACRILQGGAGARMSIVVILLSSLIGVLFHRRQKESHTETTFVQLWVFGLLVHIAMLLALLALPVDLIVITLKHVAVPIVLFYPLATVVAGKIIADQQMRALLLTDLVGSEEELKATLYSIGDAVISTDTDGLIRQMNPEAEHLTGWNEADAKGKKLETVFRIISEDFRKPIENPTQRVLKSGRAIGLTNRTLLVSKDGKERFISDRAAPIRNGNGQMTGVVLVFRDQTSQRAAEAALREAGQQWKNTFNATNDAICLLDKDQKVIQCNHAMAVLSGIDASRLIGKFCWEAVHKLPGPHPSCPIPIMLRSKKREQAELKIGSRFYEVTADPLLDDTETIQGAVHIMRDISTRKKAESALKQIQWMLTKKASDEVRQFPEQDYGSLTELNKNGLILQTVGRKMLREIAEDHMRLLDTSCAIYEMDGSYAFEIFSSGWCRRMDKATRALCKTEDNAAALACGKWKCHVSCWFDCSKQAVQTGKPVDIECHSGIRLYSVPIFADNKAIGAINFAYGNPPNDPEKLKKMADEYRIDYNDLQSDADAYDSRPPYIIEMAKERLQTSALLIGLLVEVKLAEQHRTQLERQLYQSRKMEAIGRLAGGIAHDFNNMLQIILGRTEIMQTTTEQNSIQYESLSEISKAALRSADLTRQLLAFASKQPASPKVLDVNEAVENTTELLSRLIGENIKLSWMPSPDSLRIKIDPSQLTQILTNLTTNARDAIKETGHICIQSKMAVFDQTYCDLHSGFLPGTYIQLSVRDDGKGMDKETCNLIFEPFFTTKSVGKGSGLGLSTLYGIVRQNHGFVSVQSELGKGTVFDIYLPVYTKQDGMNEQLAPSTEPPNGTETILIVEDEVTLLELGKMQLERLGYTVLSSSLPREALRLSSEYPDEIHLLLTDVVMPEMSGLELSKQVVTQRPGIKRLFMSGYTDGVINPEGTPDGDMSFLQKPFSLNNLAAKLRNVLSAES